MIFFSNTCQFYKKQYFYNPIRVSLAILMQIKKKKLFSFQLQICGRSSACRKKTRCRRMVPVPPFWDICQWQNFPGNLNTWPNTSSKRFFLLPFLQPKKNVQKSMLLHWYYPLNCLWVIGVWNVENRTHTHTRTHTYIRTPDKSHISRRFRLFWVLWH